MFAFSKHFMNEDCVEEGLFELGDSSGSQDKLKSETLISPPLAGYTERHNQLMGSALFYEIEYSLFFPKHIQAVYNITGYYTSHHRHTVFLTKAWSWMESAY